MSKILIVSLIVALILATTDLLVIALSVLLLVFAGILFGVFVGGISRWVSHHSPMSYRWSYALVVLLLIAAIAGGSFYMGSQVVQQTAQLRQELQQAQDQFVQWLAQYESLPSVKEMRKTLTSGPSVLPGLGKAINWILWGITGVVVIFFVGLYVAFDPHLYTWGIVKLFPKDRRHRATEALDQLRYALSRWIIGRLASMTIIGVITAIGLALLGVPLPVTLGVLAALLTFIPNIGPLLAAVPQALLALNVGTSTVLWVILLNIVLQGVESYLVTPLIQRHEVTLPPALTITAQLLLGATIGVIGIMMAAPLTAAVMLLVQMLYIRDRLGDSSPGELASS